VRFPRHTVFSVQTFFNEFVKESSHSINKHGLTTKSHECHQVNYHEKELPEKMQITKLNFQRLQALELLDKKVSMLNICNKIRGVKNMMK
jgi:hypothetical protein